MAVASGTAQPAPLATIEDLEADLSDSSDNEDWDYKRSGHLKKEDESDTCHLQPNSPGNLDSPLVVTIHPTTLLVRQVSFHGPPAKVTNFHLEARLILSVLALGIDLREA